MSEWTELIPRSAWSVEGLLTKEECEDLVNCARSEGIEQMNFSGDTRHRQRVTVRMELPSISQAIWERVKDHIPQEITIGEDNHEDVRGLLCEPDNKNEFIGRWTPSGMCNRVNVAYCTGKGHLAAHRDADHVLNEHERSFLTINGFLTDRPQGSGGATRFLSDDIVVSGADIHINKEDVLNRVESKEGRSVVFFHGLMHDGEPLAEGSPPKYIFRALVYYKRDPESAPKMTFEEKEARRLFKEATAAEESGDISRAIKLYNRAFKLDPSLE